MNAQSQKLTGYLFDDIEIINNDNTVRNDSILCEFVMLYAGEQIYIPKRFKRHNRYKDIIHDYFKLAGLYGRQPAIQRLTVMYGYSPRWIREILKKQLESL